MTGISQLFERYTFPSIPKLDTVLQDFRRKTNELIEYFLAADFGNLQLYDTDQSDLLTIKWNENSSNPYTLNLKVNAADRTIDLSGNLTVESASIINSDLSTDANWVTSGTITGNDLISTDNIGVGVTAWGTNAARVLGMGNATAPTTAPANMFQLWSQNRSADHAQAYYRAEGGIGRPLTQVFDVRDYNVTGDGSTDDTAAIQACADLITLGGTLYFPPSGQHYKVTGEITITNNFTSIVTDTDAEIKTTSHTAHVFNISADDCYVEATIEGSGTTVHDGSTYASLIYCTGDRLTVKNCKLINPATVGVHLYGSIGSIVDSNDIEGNYTSYPGDTHHAAIRMISGVKCVIRGNRAGKCVQGISIGSAVTINDDGESSTLSRDCTISENRFWSNVDNNLYQSSGTRNIFSENICKDAKQTNNIKVHGVDNIVVNNETYNSNGSDIVIYDGSGCIVANNRQYNPGGVGINVLRNTSSDLYNIIIEGNIIDSSGNHAIIINETGYTNIENINIKDNIIKDSAQYGILCNFATDRKRINICGNTVENSSHIGIYAKQIIESRVCDNTVFNSGTGTNREGIYLLDSDHCIVMGNLAFDNQITPTQRYGIRIDSDCEDITFGFNQAYDNVLADFSIDWAAATIKNPLSNKVGIGLSTIPDAELHVHRATAGAVTANTNSIAVLENSNDAYLSFLVPAANESGILFGEFGDNNAGGIYYNETAAADGLTFKAGGNVTLVTIGASGIGLVGTARVWKEIIIGAGSFHKGSSAPADGYINGIVHTLDFNSNDTPQHGHYEMIVPPDFVAGSEASIEVDWFFDDVEADHYVTWEMQYLTLADGEDPATGPATTYQKSVVSTGNNDKQIHTTFGTGITGAVADDTLMLRFSRDTDATNDTDDLAQDARVLAVHLHYLSDKLGAAS